MNEWMDIEVFLMQRERYYYSVSRKNLWCNLAQHII